MPTPYETDCPLPECRQPLLIEAADIEQEMECPECGCEFIPRVQEDILTLELIDPAEDDEDEDDDEDDEDESYDTADEEEEADEERL